MCGSYGTEYRVGLYLPLVYKIVNKVVYRGYYLTWFNDQQSYSNELGRNLFATLESLKFRV